MATDRRHHRVVTFLNRAGGLLATASLVAALLARLPTDRIEASLPESTASGPSDHPTTLTVGESILDGEIQVAVAESYSMSPEDWRRLLTGLSAELRLGLTMDVGLPATVSRDGAPADSLNRLLWAKSVLRAHGIELKVEQDALHVVPLAVANEPSAEA